MQIGVSGRQTRVEVGGGGTRRPRMCKHRPLLCRTSTLLIGNEKVLIKTERVAFLVLRGSNERMGNFNGVDSPCSGWRSRGRACSRCSRFRFWLWWPSVRIIGLIDRRRCHGTKDTSSDLEEKMEQLSLDGLNIIIILFIRWKGGIVTGGGVINVNGPTSSFTLFGWYTLGTHKDYK